MALRHDFQSLELLPDLFGSAFLDRIEGLDLSLNLLATFRLRPFLVVTFSCRRTHPFPWVHVRGIFGVAVTFSFVGFLVSIILLPAFLSLILE